MPDLQSTLAGLNAQDLMRVNVVGLSGSGKSTFARRLSNALKAEYIEMDSLFHGPDWTEPEVEEFRERISNAISGDRWVLDGNYHSKTHDLKWERASAIIWINTPFMRNMWQSTSRALRRAWTQEELWPGTENRESFRKSFFSSDSIILWALFNYRRIQRRYNSVRNAGEWSNICFIELRSHADADTFINRAGELAVDRPEESHTG